MRIISGTSKGRKLLRPKSQAVRPTSDRVKESIFNILGNTVEDRVALDLFAGSGSLGIEALSRGARKALFVEKGNQAVRLIRRNLEECGFSERSEILSRDVNRALGILMHRGESFDLIFMDPPYEKGLIDKSLRKLAECGIYPEDALLVIQHDRREPLPSNLIAWTLSRQRKIGDTLISFLVPGLSGSAGTGKRPNSGGVTDENE